MLIPASLPRKPHDENYARKWASTPLGSTSPEASSSPPASLMSSSTDSSARDCSESPLEADEDEELIVEWKPLGEAIDLIEAGQIIDAKSVILIQHLALEAVGPLGRKIVRHYRGQE